MQRHRLPLASWQPGWHLCLKSPEISFVLPELATLFPQARFILVYRPLPEIASSMYTLGSRVKRFPVYHARWRKEPEPPPGVPNAWGDRWRMADDFSRCVLYAAAYLASIADGAECLGRELAMVYDHSALRSQPEAVMGAIARFLAIDAEGLKPALASLRREPPAIDRNLENTSSCLLRDLSLGELPARLDAMARSSH